MANYTNQKARYGGMVGSIIIHSTDGIGIANDPNTAAFRKILPAGYLRCDGSVLNAKDFVALAKVLGVGEETRFKKETSNIRPENIEINDLGQFQLPDLGSKVIIGGRGTGLYQNSTVDKGIVEANPTTRVGPQIEVISNFGNRVAANFIGPALISAQSNLEFIGNPRYRVEKQTTETTLNIENFQGHAHRGGQKYLNYTAQHEVGGEGGKDYARRTGNSGAGNQLDFVEDAGGDSVHSHRITTPTTYGHTFRYQFPQQNVDMSPVEAYVDVDISNDDKLDQLVTPFTLVEYLIKI